MAESKRIKYDYDLISTDGKSEEINPELKKFMSKVSTTQTNTKIILTNNEKLRQLKEELPTSIGERQKSISDTLSNITEENIILQEKIKNSISQNYDEFVKDLDVNSNILEQEKRIARNLHGATVKHFQDAMLDFQSIESDIKGVNQAMIVRSAEIAMSRKLSKEEQENIVNNPSVLN